MRYEIRIQDPTEPPRSPLIDLVVELASEGSVTGGRLFFGFVTGSGIDALLASPEVARMLGQAELDVLVGLDAVTDRYGLTRLQELEAANPSLRVQVIKNTTGALIHPKMMHLTYADGGGVAVVGSNNLSANGLSGNVEGYSVLRYEPGETPDLSDWDAFLGRWSRLLSPIDEEAFERAGRNERRLDRVRRAVRAAGAGTEADVEEVVVSDGQAHETTPGADEDLQELMLVAQIPRASDRWPQVHYSADIVDRYFHAEGGDSVYLRQWNTTDVEERQVVYSEVNKNYKIELGAAGEAQRAAGYPDDGRPVVLFRHESDTQRRHRYVFLMPGDLGHAEIVALSDAEFQGPSNQVPRVIVARNQVLTAWPDCPL